MPELKNVLVGSVYKHRKGNLYRVLTVDAIYEPTGERVVVYISLDDHRIWVRPYAVFIDGRFQLR